MEISRSHQLGQNDLNQVIGLHQRILRESFLNNFGSVLLRNAYQAIAGNKNNFVLLAREEDSLLGFAVATIDTNHFIKEVIKQKFWQLSLEALKAVAAKPELLARIVRWKMKPEIDTTVNAELQFLAIDTPFQRQGLGTQMLKVLGQEFGQAGIKQYKVGTKTQSVQSNRFYQKLGFDYLYQTSIFGDDFNYYLSPKHPIA